MLRSAKRQFVSELLGVYKNSSSLIITHYHGLSVSQITTLRRALKSQGAGFKIVKNTLSKIAATQAGFETISHLLKGPTAIAYAADPVFAAQQVVEFAGACDNLKVIGGIVNQRLLDANQVQQLAKLPSLGALQSQIIGILQTPATNIINIVRTPAAKLAQVVQAYVNKS